MMLRSSLAFLIATILQVVSVSAADRPNILWITVEDMSPTLGCYGDAYARTPHIDQLASESVLYTNAFATSPVCSPSRSTLITGVYSTSLGTQDLRSAFPLPDFIDAWPAALRKAGYFCSNNVKTDYNTSDEPRLIEQAWDANHASAHWRQRSAQQPFFSIFNDMTTHQSRTGVWPEERFIEEIQSKLTPNEIHDPAEAPVPAYYPDTQVVREGIARFYDCVSVMDQNVGQLLAQLEEDGLVDNTIIFFYSDHGSGLPRGKRVLYDSGMRVPLLIRFPEKYQHLAPAAPGTSIDRLVSFVDFPATVLSLLEMEITKTMQGKPFLGKQAATARSYVFGARDRVDEAYDKARSVHDKQYLYIRNFRPDVSLNQPSAYSDFSKLKREITSLANQRKLSAIPMQYAGPTRPTEELYDVASDPLNLTNLAGDARHQRTLERMRLTLHAWIRKTRDLGFVSEEDIRAALRTHPSGYEWARSYPRFPTDDNLAAAELIGQTDTAAMQQQIVLLEHQDASVRLHAVIGLRSQPQLPAEAKRASRAAMDDANSAVRIEAAALLGDAERLGQQLLSDDENCVLRASRALELLREDGRSQVAVMQATLDRWKDRDDGPIPLFIRFSLEAALTHLGARPEDPFRP